MNLSSKLSFNTIQVNIPRKRVALSMHAPGREDELGVRLGGERNGGRTKHIHHSSVVHRSTSEIIKRQKHCAIHDRPQCACCQCKHLLK